MLGGGSRFVNLGSAVAKVQIDTSAAQASVATMRQIATQIGAIVNSINKSMGSANKASTIVDNSALRKAAQEAKQIHREVEASQKRAARAQAQDAIQMHREVLAAQKRAAQDAKQIHREVEASQKKADRAAAQEAIQIHKEVLAYQKRAAQEAKQLQKVAAPSPGTGTVNSFGVTLSPDTAMQKEASAAQSLAAQRQKALADGERQFQQAQRIAAASRGAFGMVIAPDKNMAETANAARRLEQERQSGIEKTAAAEQRRHAQQMAALRQEVEATAKAVTVAPVSVAQVNKTITTDVKAQERARRQSLLDELKITEKMVADAKAKIAVESNRFQAAAATAPASVGRSDVREQLASARQPIAELQARIAALKVSIAQSLNNPQATSKLQADLQQLKAQALAIATNGFKPLENSVTKFASAAQASRSGLQGYFTMVREGLERINETSLAANLQEVSFRLLPLGLATGAATKQGIETAQTFEEININLRQFTGSEQEAATLMGHLTEQAHRFGAPMLETLNVLTRYAPLLRQANIPLDDAYNIAARLMTLNPAQGIEGALFGINEALAGQWRSLQTRFNIPTAELRKLVSDQGFIGGFDTFLNQLGKTTDLAEKFGQTSRASFTRLNDAVSNFLASSMQPFMDSMSEGADRTTAFLNNLSKGKSVLTDIVGGFLLLTTSITTGLISLGQFALAFNALKVLIAPRDAMGNLGGIGGWIAQKLPTILPPSIVSGFTAAMPAVTTLMRGAITLAVRGGLMAAVVTGGALLGVKVAAALGVGGTHDEGEQANRLNQIIFVAIKLIVDNIALGAAIIKHGFELVGMALDFLGTSLTTAVNNLLAGVGDILTSLGTIKIGNTTLINPELLNAGAALSARREGGHSSIALYNANGDLVQSAPAPGVQMNSPQQRSLVEFMGQNVPAGQGFLVQFLEGSIEKAQRLADILAAPPDVSNINAEGQAWADAITKPLLSLMFNGAVDQKAAVTGTEGMSGGGALPQTDLLESVYGAAIQNMIAITREMEDRTLAAARDIEDFLLSRQRAIQDFNRQAKEENDDFTRQRLQQIDDFNRQTQDAEAQKREQQAKQIKDFQKQELRAQQDHLRDMLRLARSVDDAISARDFLTAQKTIQQMKDQQEDFDTQAARRREDQAAQLQELDDNLKEQEDKRREDFERQLKQADEARAIQLARQREGFQRQIEREDQDRARRLARQEQDYAIAAARRAFDFQLQIAQLDTSMNTMTFLWSHGLTGIESLISDFFTRIGVDANLSLKTGGTIVPGLPAPTPNGTPGAIPVPNGIGWRGFPSFATGAWSLSRDMIAQVHQGEMITPMPYADVLRENLSSNGRAGNRGGGDVFDVRVVIDARGSNLSEKRLSEIKQEIIDGTTEALQRAKARQRSVGAY